MDTFTFNGTRFLIGSLVLVPVWALFERDHPNRAKLKKTLLASLCAGCVLFMASLLQQYGTGLTANPGKSGFITGIYTIFTPIIYFLFFRRKSGARIWISAILAFLGLYLLCFEPGERLRFGKGELILLLGAVFFALHIIVIDLFVEHISPLKFACGQFFVCGMLNLFMAFLFGNPTWQGIQGGLKEILFCGIFSAGIGFTAQIIGQKMAEDATRSAILLSTESLFSLLGGLVWNALPIPDEYRVEATLTVFGLLGCGIIFFAIILSQLPARKTEEKSLPVSAEDGESPKNC